MAEHNIIGQKGEEIAAKIMRKKGFRVVDTNWKCGHLEIDVIAVTPGQGNPCRRSVCNG